jgi:SAM-dependent methyltransferase
VSTPTRTASPPPTIGAARPDPEVSVTIAARRSPLVQPPGKPAAEAGWEPQWERRWQLPWRESLPEAYLTLAHDYERRTRLFTGWRELLVHRLAARPGDTVIDVGCGPGLNFAALHAAVGPHGTIIAIEESPRLLAVAARQVTRRRWDNVELINAPADTARLATHADAALFAAAPEAVASAAAVTNIVDHLRPGAGVAAGGWKWPSTWLWPLRTLLTALGSPLTDVIGFDQPWRLLAEHVATLHVSEIGFGTGYLAHTRRADRH